VPIVVLIVGLSLIGLFAVAVAPDFGVAPTSPGPSASIRVIAPKATPPARPDGIGIADPKDVDPFALLADAKNRATAWDREAVLVSIEAGPVLAGKVDLTAGAKVEYTFGKPTGGGFDTAGRVGPKQLLLSVDSSGPRVEEIARAATRAAMEPNCTFDEAVKIAEASGAAPGAPLRVRYFMSERHEKAIWQTEVPEDPKTRRVLDGWTCTVLVR
jgi:hypothetical protein